MCSKWSLLSAGITVLIVLFCASCIHAAPLEIISYKEGCKESKINNGLKCGMFIEWFLYHCFLLKTNYTLKGFLKLTVIHLNIYSMGIKAFPIDVLYDTNKWTYIFFAAREFDRLWNNEKTIHCPLQIIICMVSVFCFLVFCFLLLFFV